MIYVLSVIPHHCRCKPALGSMIRLSELEHYEHVQSYDDDNVNDSGLGGDWGISSAASTVTEGEYL